MQSCCFRPLYAAAIAVVSIRYPPSPEAAQEHRRANPEVADMFLSFRLLFSATCLNYRRCPSLQLRRPLTTSVRRPPKGVGNITCRSALVP